MLRITKGSPSAEEEKSDELDQSVKSWDADEFLISSLNKLELHQAKKKALKLLSEITMFVASLS